MILTQNTLVTISPSNIKHYESLGYEIPKYKDKYYRIRIKKGTQIRVNVSDLPKGTSKIKVLCKCEICEKENLVVYNTIQPKYLCQKCTNTLPELIKIKSVKISGKNNYCWNFNLTDQERKIKHKIPGIDKWRKQVKQKDNYTCQKCGSKHKLEAHHINNFANYKHQRLCVENGITLCFSCHKGKNKSIHHIYGSFTTQENLNEFLCQDEFYI